LKNVDNLISRLPIIRSKLEALVYRADQDPHAEGFTALTEYFENLLDSSFSAPAEGQRLHCPALPSPVHL
jgi:hypothetical protein